MKEFRRSRRQHGQHIAKAKPSLDTLTKFFALVIIPEKPGVGAINQRSAKLVKLQTRVSEALAIQYPIIQGPLGGFSSQKLTAAVSNFGGLGSFGAHGLEPDAVSDVIAEIRSLTAKPFAMNLWVSMEDTEARSSDATAFNRALSHLAPHIEAVGGARRSTKTVLPSLPSSTASGRPKTATHSGSCLPPICAVPRRACWAKCWWKLPSST
jgi:hypothetical protein